MPKNQTHSGTTGGERKPARDAHGRWLAGHCPNPRGRPRKPQHTNIEGADIWLFAREKIQIRAGGEMKEMPRFEALLHRLYEDAMKGKPTAQRRFLEMLKEREKDIAEFRHRYEDLVTKWIRRNPKFGTSGPASIPESVRVEIAVFETLLNRFMPDAYPMEITPLLGLDDQVGE